MSAPSVTEPAERVTLPSCPPWCVTDHHPDGPEAVIEGSVFHYGTAHVADVVTATVVQLEKQGGEFDTPEVSVHYANPDGEEEAFYIAAKDLGALNSAFAIAAKVLDESEATAAGAPPSLTEQSSKPAPLAVSAATGHEPALRGDICPPWCDSTTHKVDRDYRDAEDRGVWHTSASVARWTGLGGDARSALDVCVESMRHDAGSDWPDNVVVHGIDQELRDQLVLRAGDAEKLGAALLEAAALIRAGETS